jgi:DTW domain-containing protein YfiP
MRTDDDHAEPVRRETCARCRRPSSVCYCAHLVQIPSQTRVVVLQHPREEGRPIGTAHMATLCLPEASLHVGVGFDDAPILEEILADPSREAVLLYPGEEARDIVAEPPSRPVTLVVVDGTWAQAKKLVKTNRRLASMPRVSFVPPAPSEYRIRREPKETYLSTLESLVLVLGALEADPAKFEPLLTPFRAMIDKQLDCERTFQGARARRKRNAARERRVPLPDALLDRTRTHVCVSGEVNAWPYGAPERDAPDYRDEVVVWVAERLETGERFAAIASPTYALSVGAPLHAEVERARIDGGLPRAELLARWAGFLRETDVLCTWGHHAPGLLIAEGAAMPTARVDVRAAARLAARGKVGTLEEHGGHLGCAASRTIADHGRAARRLALLGGIVRTLRGER